MRDISPSALQEACAYFPLHYPMYLLDARRIRNGYRSEKVIKSQKKLEKVSKGQKERESESERITRATQVDRI
ncbi:MAG: hypothetical protein NVS4B9_15670 [Ktedonobacteraceae bacterium]